jgi:flagellar hook-basal body complex protein FliE
MSPLGAINPLNAGSQLNRVLDAQPAIAKPALGLGGTSTTAPSQSFGQLIDGLVSTVETKSNQAQDVTRKALLGEGTQLHQSVIAMQEASVAFSMMIEVRNKLVDSYQELMRMQV